MPLESGPPSPTPSPPWSATLNSYVSGWKRFPWVSCLYATFLHSRATFLRNQIMSSNCLQWLSHCPQSKAYPPYQTSQALHDFTLCPPFLPLPPCHCSSAPLTPLRSAHRPATGHHFLPLNIFWPEAGPECFECQQTWGEGGRPDLWYTPCIHSAIIL